MMQTQNLKASWWSHHWVFLGHLSRRPCMPFSQKDPCKKFCLNPSCLLKKFLLGICTQFVFSSVTRVQELCPEWSSFKEYHTQPSWHMAQRPWLGSQYPNSLHPGRYPTPTDWNLKCLSIDKAIQGPRQNLWITKCLSVSLWRNGTERPQMSFQMDTQYRINKLFL